MMGGLTLYLKTLQVKDGRRVAIWIWPVCGLLLLTALCLLFGNHASELNLLAKSQGPSWTHPMGTDWLGRDMAERSGAAMLKSLWIGALAVLLSSSLALLLALLAQTGSRWRQAILLCCDLCMSLPHLLLLILLALAFGGQEYGVIAALALSHWPRLTRLLLLEMDEILAQPYVSLALGFGGSRFSTRMRHLWPHIMPQWLIGGLNLFPHALLHVAALSFLGFGLDSNAPSMGELLAEANRYLLLGQWWLALFPGLLLLSFILLLSKFAENLIQFARDGMAAPKLPGTNALESKSDLIPSIDVKPAAIYTQVTDLTLKDSNGRTLLDGLNIEVVPGQVTAVLGESGAGKSLLALAIMGSLPKGIVMQCAGLMRPQKTALCAQSTQVLDANIKISELLDWYCDEAMRPYRQALYGELGITTEILAAYPPMLSGGMARRVLLAQALLQAPDLLLADEPCCGLDELAATELYALLNDVASGALQLRLGLDAGPKAVLVISHNLRAVLALDAELYLLRRGRLAEVTDSASLRASLAGHKLGDKCERESCYSQTLLAALPENWPAGSCRLADAEPKSELKSQLNSRLDNQSASQFAGQSASQAASQQKPHGDSLESFINSPCRWRA
ncbi:ABC transporter permease subunit [Shewanella algae]|uniref:ABC transporter permease subunit n=1 Tax=Shewanella algae TaxID=38313 RepID=UPI001AAD12B3|nr:ATP-binding cassette domain-containing protein [Shewanella algae]MBO2578196.1 ATP-binding cassette domain-containing protein [Shewanella algae]MBO2683655.1 ATP-binding cassette domain-containing protein [Shewanella algae]